MSTPSLPPSRWPSFLGAGGWGAAFTFRGRGLEESGKGRPWRPSPCPSSKGRQPLIDLWLRRQTTCLRQCRHSFCHAALVSVAVVAHFTISLSTQLPSKEDLSLTGPAPAQTILPVSHPTARGQAPCRGSPGSSYNVLSKEKGHYPLTSHGRSLNCSPDSSSSLTTVSCLMNALLILPEYIYSFQVETSEGPFSHENSVVSSTVCTSRPVSRFVFVFPWWLRW